MTEVGYAALGIIPSFDGFQAKLEQGSGKALIAAGTSGGAKFGESAGKAAKGKFSSMAKGIVAPLLGAFAAVKVKDFLKDAIAGASDLNETTNKVQQVFGKASKQVFRFSRTADKALGQTDQQARDAAASFGIYGKAAHLTDKENAKFSVRMTKLASDLASFHNTSPEQAIEALGSALRGEAEPMRAYGVLLDDATMRQEAVRLGLIKTTKEALTPQNKVLAAQALIFKQTKVAQGDFARTSGGLANQQRILAAQFDNAKAKLGKALLPTVLDVVKFLNQKGVPAFEHFSDWFTQDGIPAIAKFERKAEPFVKGVLTETRDILKEAEPYAKGFAKAFASLPDGVKKGLGAAAILGIGSKKLGLFGLGKGLLGGKGGALGGGSGLLGLVTKSKPLPVWVVNGGVGGSGLPGVAGKAGAAGKVEKFGKWGGLLGLPGLVAAGTGVALAKGHPLSGMPPITGMAAKAITGFIDKRKIDDTTASVLRQNDAWSKVRDNLENGTTKAHILSGEIMGTRREVEKLTGPRHNVKIEAPNLLNLLDNTRRYGFMLDGLDGRVVRTFLTTVTRHQSGTGGTTDSGESIGKHSPTAQRSSTSGGNVFDFSGSTIVPHDYSDFMYQTQQRARRASLDGIRR